MIKFNYSTGGRENYFNKKNVGDCVCRAICNATGKDYMEVYNKINELENKLYVGKHERRGSARDGVRPKVYKHYLEKELGYKFVATMTIGSGCNTHIREDELPKGKKIILRLSKHLTCYEDGTIYDTYDCSRDETRCVYGYWYK